MTAKLVVLVFLVLLLTGVSSQSSSNCPPGAFISGYSIINEAARQVTFYDVHHYLFAPENLEVKLRVYGHFTKNSHLKFSKYPDCRGKKGEKKLRLLDSSTAEADFILPEASKDQGPIYFCLRDGSGKSTLQGKNGKIAHPWLTIKVLKTFTIPLWLQLIFIAILLSLSSLMSGLNLGLLALDKTDLKVIINTGSQKERTEASKIAPVRNHGNYLLCTLLCSNVLVNNYLTLLINQVLGGADWTVAVSTIATVLVGEVLPQAVCSRYGLTVGAKTIWITKLFMTLSFPVSYPMGKILDKILGEEIGAVYTRDRLKELLRVTRDQHGLESEEMGIISGTLDMRTKTVKDVMTHLEHMYMIPYDAVLNVDLLVSIEESGFTRIPVYQGERRNVVGVLNVKNLTLYDPGQSITVKNQLEQHKQHMFIVFENTRLDYMLKVFREGSKGHIAFVQRINDEGPGDPKYETIGLVTLEDVLEEILQAEIYDENDVEHMQTKGEDRKTMQWDSTSSFHIA